MPLCYNCKKFFPTGFINKTNEGDDLCTFCERDTKILVLKDKNNKTVILEKSEIEKKYKQFLDRMNEENKKIKNNKLFE